MSTKEILVHVDLPRTMKISSNLKSKVRTSVIPRSAFLLLVTTQETLMAKSEHITLLWLLKQVTIHELPLTR